MSDSVKKWHEIQEDKQTLSEEHIDSIAMQMDLKMWESFSSIISNTISKAFKNSVKSIPSFSHQTSGLRGNIKIFYILCLTIYIRKMSK